MDCLPGEELIGCAQHKGSLGDILGFNRVANINQLYLRIDTEYYPFHSSYIGVSQTEVGSQGYYGTHIIPNCAAADY